MSCANCGTPLFNKNARPSLGRLRIRRMLRHPIMTTIAYLLVLSSACWLGSRTIWKQYDILQMPSLLLGLFSSFGALAIGLSIVRIAQWARFGKFDWTLWKIAQFRHGSPTVWFLILALFSTAVAIVIGPPPDQIDELFKTLETSREGLEIVKDRAKQLRLQPRYASNEEITFVEKVADYWTRSGTLKQEESLNQANSFLRQVNHPQLRVRSWSLVMAADGFDRAGRQSDAMTLYTQVAQIKEAPEFLHAWALNELGIFSYQTLNDIKTAIEYWKQTINIKPTSGVLDNLALAYADNGNFDAAEAQYVEAERLLLKESAAPTNPKRPLRFAVLYANWANCLRRRMEAEGISSSESVTYKRGIELCKKAAKELPCHLDAYWIEARIAITAADWQTARAAIQASKHAVDKCDLSRFKLRDISPRMNLWLEAVVNFTSPNAERVEANLRRRFLETFKDFKTAPYTSIHRFLAEVKASDLSIDDDLRFLTGMADKGFFEESLPKSQ